uniref:Uncharacterized protein n=1 Tax=Spermophilus dauricus TaxID=99837 RepID=A0A8C9PT67_SPEDA
MVCIMSSRFILIVANGKISFFLKATQVWWYMPVIPATQQAEAGGSQNESIMIRPLF